MFQTTFKWNIDLPNESALFWSTNFPTSDEIDFFVQPSYITIKNKRWDIKNESNIEWSSGRFSINDFKFERADQYFSIDGEVAKNSKDKIKIKASHIQLSDFSDILPNSLDLEGELNAFANITDPFANIKYSGDAGITNLIINKERVGNVFVQSDWDNQKKRVGLKGDLDYLDQETFSFLGSYTPSKSKESLNINFNFDNTDVAFTNAFLDPNVVDRIQGNLNGKMSIKGTPSEPRMKGKIFLSNGSADIKMLGATFKTNGEIEIDESGFYLNNVPLTDAEGNTGSVVGSIFYIITLPTGILTLGSIYKKIIMKRTG